MREWVRGGVGVEREEEKPPQVKHEVTCCPQMILTTQLGQRGIILGKGIIPGNWHTPQPTGVGHGFTRL